LATAQAELATAAVQVTHGVEERDALQQQLVAKGPLVDKLRTKVRALMADIKEATDQLAASEARVAELEARFDVWL
jgi:phage shock protein A